MNPPRLVLTVSTSKTYSEAYPGVRFVVADLLAIGEDPSDDTIVLHKLHAAQPLGLPGAVNITLGGMMQAMAQMILRQPGILAVSRIDDGHALVLAHESAPDDNMALIRAVKKHSQPQ